MKLIRSPGVTSEIWQLFIQDSSRSDGGGLTGLSASSSGLACYYSRDSAGAAVQVPLVSMTPGVYTSGGFVGISDSFMPGWYQFCPPNAALAAGAKSVAFALTGSASNVAEVSIEVDMQAGADIANDVWNVMLPGSYAVGTAGYILGNLTLHAIADAVWSTPLPGPYVLPEAGAQVLQAYNELAVYTNVELTGVPASTATLHDMLLWVFQMSRNRITQTAAVQTLYGDDNATVHGTCAVSDDGTVFTRGKFQ